MEIVSLFSLFFSLFFFFYFSILARVVVVVVMALFISVNTRACRTPMSVCFSFSHRILSFIWDNGTRVLASCCFSLFLFCVFSPYIPHFAYRHYDFICWLLILHDVCVCVCVSFFTRSCTLFVFPFVLLFFISFFLLF